METKTNVPVTVVAGLSYPHGIAKSPDGCFFIGDQNNNQIKKLIPKPDGTYQIQVVAGSIKGGFKNGTFDSALFNFIGSIALDQHDNLFVSDTWNHCVRILELNKKWVSTFLPEKLEIPSGTICINKNRALAIDRKSQYLYVIEREGTLLKIHIDSRKCCGKCDVGPLTLPRGLAIDNEDNIYFTTGSSVEKMDKNFQNKQVLCTLVAGPRSLCLDSTCRFLYIGTNVNVVRMNTYTKQMKPICDIDWAAGIALDGKGHLFICEYSTGRIKKVKVMTTVSWKLARIVWIGHLKNSPQDCLLASVPPEIVKEILSFCDE